MYDIVCMKVGGWGWGRGGGGGGATANKFSSELSSLK